MDRNMRNRVIFSFLVGIFYWFADCVKSSMVNGSPLISTFLGEPNQADFVVRIAIFIFIFMIILMLSFLFIPHSTNNKKNLQKGDKKDTSSVFFNKINKSLISNSMALKYRLVQVSKLIEERYKFQKVIISLESNKNLEIVNFDSSFIPYTGEKKIISVESQNNTVISQIIVRQYQKQLGFSQKKIEPPIKSLDVWGIVNIALISKKNSKIIGMITVLLESKKSINDDLNEILKSLAENISFFISFDKQKFKLHKEFSKNKKDLEFSRDLTLNIQRVDAIQNILNLEIKRASRYNSKLSILIFQIDNLESIFTGFGEEITNQAQKDVARSIKKNIRDLDSIGNWHDHKFIIVAPETGSDGAVGFAEKLISDIRATRFAELNNITCSFGIVWFTRTDINHEVEFIKKAEKALQNGIDMGGDRIVLA